MEKKDISGTEYRFNRDNVYWIQLPGKDKPEGPFNELEVRNYVGNLSELVTQDIKFGIYAEAEKGVEDEIVTQHFVNQKTRW